MKYSLRSLMPNRHWFQISLHTLLLNQLFLGLYLGNYKLLLCPVEVHEIGNGGFIYSHREPKFWVGGAASQVVFAPLVWADRRFRDDYWNERLNEY